MKANISHIPRPLLIAVVCLLFIFSYLQYRLWFSEGSLSQLKIINQDIELAKKTNETLLNRNEKLAKEIVALQNGTELLEEYAREEMNMVRKGETFYLLSK